MRHRDTHTHTTDTTRTLPAHSCPPTHPHHPTELHDHLPLQRPSCPHPPSFLRIPSVTSLTLTAPPRTHARTHTHAHTRTLCLPTQWFGGVARASRWQWAPPVSERNAALTTAQTHSERHWCVRRVSFQCGPIHQSLEVAPCTDSHCVVASLVSITNAHHPSPMRLRIPASTWRLQEIAALTHTQTHRPVSSL